MTSQYDPFGRRIEQISPSGTTIYAYDGDNVVEELDGGGAAAERYAQGLGIDEPLAMYRGGASYYYNADGLGGAFGNSTPGSGKLFLMRGPFVLPEWSTANPTPGLVSASPASAAAGSGNLTLTVTGSGFVPGAVLKWNGAERTTTFVDSSHLTVAIPKADLTHAGTATVVVNNPGSSDSSSISFTVN